MATSVLQCGAYGVPYKQIVRIKKSFQVEHIQNYILELKTIQIDCHLWPSQWVYSIPLLWCCEAAVKLVLMLMLKTLTCHKLFLHSLIFLQPVMVTNLTFRIQQPATHQNLQPILVFQGL
jgi:hypothetical protein